MTVTQARDLGTTSNRLATSRRWAGNPRHLGFLCSVGFTVCKPRYFRCMISTFDDITLFSGDKYKYFSVVAVYSFQS